MRTPGVRVLRPLPQSARLLRLAPILVLGGACTTTPNILPTNDFNRPTDVAFMCFGAFDPTTGTPAGADGGTVTPGTLRLSGRPMRACHLPAGPTTFVADPAPAAATRTFAFMPDSGSGEISVVDADSWHIVDLDPAVGGYGRAPLGTAAEQISASDDGCRIVSANRGSCDLSLVDPTVLLAPTFDAAYGLEKPLPAPQTYRQTVVPHRPDGTPLGAAPYEIAFLPQDTSSLDSLSADSLCQADGARVPTVGFASTPGAMPWRALVTFPSCDLVALINLPSGEIVDSWTLTGSAGQTPQVTSSGAFPPACPVMDCLGQPTSPISSGGAAGTGAAGAGAGVGGGLGGSGAGGSAGGAGGSTGGGSGGVLAGSGGGGTSSGGSSGAGAGTGGNAGSGLPAGVFRPAGIAIAPPTIPASGVADGVIRAYVSLSGSDNIFAIDVSSAGLAMPPHATVIPVAGVYGSDRIRLSVNPYLPNTNAQGVAGRFIGGVPERQYLYVVGHDGTIRVVWAVPGQERECETNVDPTKRPANVSATDWANTACFPVDPYGSTRRPFVYTSGIQLPSIPIDVAVADVRPSTAGDSEVTVSGAFVYALTANGTVYLVNLVPDPLRSLSVVTKVDSNNQFVADTADGTYMSVLSTSMPPLPRFSEPQPFVSTLRDRNQMSYSPSLDPFSGPARIPLVPTPSFTLPFVESFWARGTRNNALAVDTSYIQTIAYFQDPSAVAAQTWTVTWEGLLMGARYGGKVSGNTLSDGASFCNSGVLPGDLVTFTGCTDDTQCIPGYKCHRDPTAAEAPGGLQVTGLCVPPDAEAARAGSCPAAFQTLRRYEIQEARQNQLALRPHLDELVHSTLTPCESRSKKTTGADAGALNADGGASDGGDVDGGADDGGATDGGTTGGSQCDDLTDPSTIGFKCSVGPRAYQTGQTRCLKTCTTSADCRSGRSCWRPGSCTNAPQKACSSYRDCDANDTTSCQFESVSFCVDAPPVADLAACLDQLVVYNVSAGGSYVVTGSVTGLLSYGKAAPAGEPTEGLCESLKSPAEIDWRVVGRIPISNNGLVPPAITCQNVHPVPTDPADVNAPGDWHDKFDSRGTSPPDEKSTPNQPLSWLKTDPTLHSTENPCLFIGGPNASDTTTASMQTHVRALFANTQLSFVLTNVDWEPPGGLSTRFDVAGGARAQYVVYPPTVEVSEPARIVLGPIDSQSQTASPAPTFEAPYLFVVDRRRLGRSQGGGPTRGQLLRINPIGFAASTTTPAGTVQGTQPIYEDYTRSGGLFPVQ